MNLIDKKKKNKILLYTGRAVPQAYHTTCPSKSYSFTCIASSIKKKKNISDYKLRGRGVLIQKLFPKYLTINEEKYFIYTWYLAA